VDEHSSAANDEVNLVLCVWRLLARAQREAKGHVKSATLQDRHGALARWAGDTRLSLDETNNTTAFWLAHASLLVPSALDAKRRARTQAIPPLSNGKNSIDGSWSGSCVRTPMLAAKKALAIRKA